MSKIAKGSIVIAPKQALTSKTNFGRASTQIPLTEGTLVTESIVSAVMQICRAPSRST
jgi:hypothetical protein